MVEKSPPKRWARASFPMRIEGSHNYSRSAPEFQLNEDLPSVEGSGKELNLSTKSSSSHPRTVD